MGVDVLDSIVGAKIISAIILNGNDVLKHVTVGDSESPYCVVIVVEKEDGTRKVVEITGSEKTPIPVVAESSIGSFS